MIPDFDPPKDMLMHIQNWNYKGEFANTSTTLLVKKCESFRQAYDTASLWCKKFNRPYNHISTLQGNHAIFNETHPATATGMMSGTHYYTYYQLNG